jgi:hypothetical protein
MMVCNNQNYWVLGLCPLKNTIGEHRFVETLCFLSLARGETPSLWVRLKVLYNYSHILGNTLDQALSNGDKTYPGLRYLYICSYNDVGCPMIKVSSA